MKLIIAGSRSITDINYIYKAIEKYNININEITEIVSGTANGVDKLGEEFAKEYDIKIIKFPAKWKKYGKRAGFLRNRQMAEYADELLAIWDQKSKGTKHMINDMNLLWKRVYLYRTNE